MIEKEKKTTALFYYHLGLVIKGEKRGTSEGVERSALTVVPIV
ncbi:unknown [[Mannheimia] succiniciproducens MBEL55E]|uniref:Uncharacterized protein n=1 Tax=Mannheimia succiniciproducens (strain KCTC 0769BP / MBEL55E) TaxID=221988 RepID=Q65Q49_MANSM|nr:unknown [[Mannheimia] succiniciproducens MBEL55E]AAU38911.1 unknown [[Mannheimia] succiniciproducens MBEL55E]